MNEIIAQVVANAIPTALWACITLPILSAYFRAVDRKGN